MNKIIVLTMLLCSITTFSQNVLHTDLNTLSIKVNGKIVSKNWKINPLIKPDIFSAELSQEISKVTYLAGKDSISFNLKVNEHKDFYIVKNKVDTAFQRVIGIKPNVTFSDEYVKMHKGKTIVDIPEVSELVNVLMALHQDAEKEGNMFDTKTEYFQKIKKHFSPYLTHPALDTIQKYIKDLSYMKEHNINMFSNDSYRYYYALKMNACSYKFDANNNIINKGDINQMAKGWYSFDPMKDAKLFEDFAKVSNFRKFYKENNSYYNSLLKTYDELNPIQKMQTWLDNKFGFGYGSYLVYFSPLVYGAHSTSRFEDNGLTQTVMFIARADYDEKLSKTQNELLESRVVFTEIDHNYVNPTSDSFLKEINESLSNREKWAKENITSMYPNPYTVFNEYMTFGVYSLYVNDNFSKEDAQQYYPKLENQMVDSRGFILFKEFNQVLLKHYQANPKIKMKDLYTYMLKWCKTKNS